MFPQSEFIATNKFENKVGRIVSEEDVKVSEEMKDLEVVELLMHSNVMVYEKSDNIYNLCLGI